MSSPNIANIANLCSGQIQFADPTKPWSPNDFPNMPSSMLGITAIGTIETANISTLSFTNTILYEPYEPSSIYSTLWKTLQIDQSGVVAYKEPTVGFVSTLAPAFCGVDISGFTPSSIGGPGINDVRTGKPDTITNALAKLDGWIANAFLLQPPAVTPVELETTSLYGGMRWMNFCTYNLLDKFVPYVTSMMFIVGDPESTDYCTFEVSMCDLFPYKLYTDGISPVRYPLVKLRIYTDCFLMEADELYSKAVMQTRCVRIVTETGNVTFPNTGKVFAVDYTNGTDTYTTMSLYLPNLPVTYPKNSEIPLYIAYLNQTDGPVNVVHTSTIINSVGSPGPLQMLAPTDASQSTVTFMITAPTYADTTALVEAPLYSSYQFNYTLEQMNTAYDATTGFRYGIPSPTTIPVDLAGYSNITFTEGVPFISYIQSTIITGTQANPLVPGAVWSTSMEANNCAMLPGPSLASPYVSTLFPLQSTPTLVSTFVIPVADANPGLVEVSQSSIYYTSYNNGWTIDTNVSTDVLFFNNSTAFVYATSTFSQFNDSTLPGDRSTITLETLYTNADQNTLLTSQFALSTTADDFTLNSVLIGPVYTTASMIATIIDSQTDTTSQHYFYNVVTEASQTISTISTATQSVQVAIQNTITDGVNLYPQTLSSQSYTFITDQDNPYATLDIQYNGIVTSTIMVSGLLTAASNAELCMDIVGQNFGNVFMGSTYGYAVIGTVEQYTNLSTFGGPLSVYSTNIHFYTPAGEITTLPFPQNTNITMSSVCVSFFSTLYTPPVSTPTLFLQAALKPASPLQTESAYVSTFASPMFIDAPSATYVSSFSNTTGSHGLRVSNLLPRMDIVTVPNNMYDNVDNTGNSGQGLNVSVSSFFAMNYPNVFAISTSAYYNNQSTISTIFTDPYSRELLYTNGQYVHPGGLNFSQFSGTALGDLTAIYPDFTNDLINDVNDGYRYASFAFESQEFITPTPIQFINIRVKNPNYISTLGFISSANLCWPNDVVDPYVVPNMNVRIHVKYFGAYDIGTYETVESEWINGLKECDQFIFNDQTFDIGGNYYVSTISNDIIYSVQMNRRFYTKLGYIVRIGISESASYQQVSTNAISFDSITTYLTDDITATQTDITANIY